MLPDFRVRQRDYLLEISRALTKELDLDKLLERILHISLEMLVGRAGIIALRTSHDGWKVRVSSGVPTSLLRFIEPQLAQISEDQESGDVWFNMINHVVSNFTQAVSLGRLSSVGLPLITGQKIIGVILVFRENAGFSPNDRALLASFADQAAIAVQNAQLYTQVENDRRRVSGLLDSAADGILILTHDFQIERANPSFAFLIGKQAEEMVGKQHDEIIVWAKHPQGATLTESVEKGWPLTPQATLYVEGDLLRDKGSAPIPVGITYAPLVSEQGNLVNIITTVRDITRFREADELKSTFVSVVSHELKTPVALIKGYVGTLRRDDAHWDKEIINDSLQIIEEEADRLNGYIENLLDVTRLQASGFSLKLNDIQLAEVIKHTAERMQVQTTKHKIRVNIPQPLPIIVADDGRINQVITNLVSNSIKYAPDGEIVISSAQKGENIITCVSDDGPGIDPKDLPFVFDRFYRSPSASKNTKGTGLGLYLAKAIVEAHGGRIWIDQHIGKGGRICFCLPIANPETPG
ncbi:MAG: PAS domain-containing protein [Anaerolineaceae bacterium]|nr:PAS domain-containing protein [Anaerolineaceae bacterium]